MPLYEQAPGTLNLVLKQGDDFSALLDADISLSGYTVTANVSSLVTGGTVASLNASLVDAAAGKFNVSLTRAQSLAIPRGTYGWTAVWVGSGVTRTSVAGLIEVL
jgi:hypothetical protein